jgi:DNA repair exonuclease SbcCD nuclease subunit
MHLRPTAPESRTDDYFAAQAKKVAFIADLQREHECPVIDAGDVFNTWKPGEYMCQWAIKNLPDGIITIPGNHDLPNHNLSLYEKSGLAVLEAAKKIVVLKDDFYRGQDFAVYGIPYGSRFVPLINEWKKSKKSIAVVHVYVAESVPSFITDGYTPQQLLDALPGYDLIVSGHNHTPLIYEKRGRLVVNPGSLMRMFADQADMKPCVWLWYADTNEVDAVYLPIERGVVSRDHIEKREDRDTRMEAFVSRLKGDVNMALSFEENLERYIKKNKISEETEKIIWEVVNGG